MYKIVLLRHGQSVWNKENKFTGWTDVDLSPEGNEEALDAGRRLNENNLLNNKQVLFDKLVNSFDKFNL